MSKYVMNYNELNKASKSKENKAMNKREERLEALKAGGVTTDNFIMEIGKMTPGSEIKITIGADGKPQIVGLDVKSDPVVEQIFANNYVRNTKLHRRWVLAQMWEALNYSYQPYVYVDGHYVVSRCKEEGFNAWLKNTKDYNYQFTMMLEEVRVISKLEASDEDSFRERSSFFTKEVVVATCNDYLDKLKSFVGTKKVKHCKGIEYVTIGGTNIFVNDLQNKLYNPVSKSIESIKKCNSYYELYKSLKSFIETYVKKYGLPRGTKKCSTWIDAYKGAGAYYSLMNMLKFHNCFITNYETKEVLSGYAGVKCLESLVGNYEGWQFMAMLKKAIADNNFDLARSIEANK